MTSLIVGSRYDAGRVTHGSERDGRLTGGLSRIFLASGQKRAEEGTRATVERTSIWEGLRLSSVVLPFPGDRLQTACSYHRRWEQGCTRAT